MRARNHQPQADAGRRYMQCRVESGWPMGSQWRGRRCGQGVLEVQRGSRQASVVV